MSCHRFKKTLVEYSDGRLDAAGVEKVESHIASCNACRQAADMLALSRSALADLSPVSMPEEASSRVSATLASVARGEKKAPDAGGRFSFMWSPRTLAAAGTGVAILLGIMLVVIAYTGPPKAERKAADGGFTSVTSAPAARGTTPETLEESIAKGALPSTAAMILPVVKKSQNNYDENTLRSTIEDLDIKDQVEANCTMGHAISLGGPFKRKMADMMVDAGCDGAMLEAMITYLTTSEPVLLPYYAENALFTGQNVYIIGFAGPRRMGETTKLSRTEVWVMSPEKFSASPDSSIVFFLETRSE